MKTKQITQHRLAILIAATPFLLGGFFTWAPCLISIVLSIVLARNIFHQRKLTVSYSISSLAMLLIPLCYLLTALWGQDRGMALPGFCRVLPLLLWALLLWQETPAHREEALEVIPWSGAVMTVICVPLSYLPIMDGHLLVNGRQAGLFEYPNTYALFLLLGLIVLATREKYRWYHGLMAATLLAGIFLSGSRTVFVLLGVTAILLAIFTEQKLVRLCIIIAVPVAIAAAVVYVTLSGDVSSIGRFLTTSLHSSTLLGRILYARDALPVILKHPFGIGYGAYATMQGSFQTGVYSVQSAHNDLLQLMLDAGWAPAIVLVVAIVKTLLQKGNTLRRRLLLGVICAHGLFDFSLQFLSVLLILVLLLNFDNCKEIRLKRGDKGFLTAMAGIIVALSLYFGAVTGMAYLGKHESAVKLDGSYTDSLISLLTKERDMDKAKEYAQRILDLNHYVAPAYRVQAATAYSAGDMTQMMEYQRKAIACAPYDITVYTDYMDMLSVGEQLYTQSGDTQSAEQCRQELASVPQMVQATLDKTSTLGFMIDDKPELELPEEYLAMIG